MNPYAKFDQIPSNRLQEIERKRNLKITKGHNCNVYLEKLTRSNRNPDLVSINEYAQFALIPSRGSQDIERKRNSDDNQRP